MLRRAGYGGGMSSAKAALESDTRVLAFEAGRKFGVRVNTISAGPLGSRAAKVCTHAAVWGCVALQQRACMQMQVVLPCTRCGRGVCLCRLVQKCMSPVCFAYISKQATDAAEQRAAFKNSL